MSNAAATKDNVEILDNAPRPSNAITPYDMVTQAVANGASLDVVGRLLDLHERWESTRARKAFDAAMSDAKAEIGPIAKNRLVDFKAKNSENRTNYRHEDLAEVARTIDPVLARHGLSYRFQTQQEGTAVRVTCIVAHRDGHSETNSLVAGNDASGNKNSIQAIGSTITYLQRYTLKAALGLAASNDDDGKKSEETPEQSRKLSAAQVKAIEDKINETNASTVRLLKQADVTCLEDIDAVHFDAIMAMLSEYGAKKAKPNA